jgi:hypothetical protein
MKGANCLLVAFALIGISGAAPAAPLATGKVVGPNSEPQAGVPVQVHGPTGSTILYTDAKGNWSLYNLRSGSYRIEPLAPQTEAKGPASTNAKQEFVVPKQSFLESWLGAEKTIKVPELKLDGASAGR